VFVARYGDRQWNRRHRHWSGSNYISNPAQDISRENSDAERALYAAVRELCAAAAVVYPEHARMLGSFAFTKGVVRFLETEPELSIMRLDIPPGAG
jgi:hypothetical protein